MWSPGTMFTFGDDPDAVIAADVPAATPRE
jgi:hypothetical protein